jgi:aerobic carbon-monoxide dehydrogenase medium subunit
MYRFEYHKASSLDEAAALLEKTEDGTLLAGGMTLIPVMKQRLAMPSDVIDLKGISGLDGISKSDRGIEIGAMATHAQVAASEIVQKHIPALASLARGIGDAAIRNRGTIGGSIATSDPAADYPAAVLGLGASIITNRRQIAADDYFLALFETALEDGEIIKNLVFPIPQAANYQKFSNPASRYAIVGVFLAKTADGVRVGVTGAGPCAFCAQEIEITLDGDFSAAALGGVPIPSEGFNEDVHASAEYRAHLVGVMAARAVEAIRG